MNTRTHKYTDTHNGCCHTILAFSFFDPLKNHHLYRDKQWHHTGILHRWIIHNQTTRKQLSIHMDREVSDSDVNFVIALEVLTRP